MERTINIIANYSSKPTDSNTTMINEKLRFFNLRSFETVVDEQKLKFLKKLNVCAQPEFKIDDNGSAVYFFKGGESLIELDISVYMGEISILPYIRYDDSNISKDLMKITKIDTLLYSLLRKNGLQKR